MQTERIEEMRLGDEDDARIARLLAAAYGNQNGEGPDGGFDRRSFFQLRHHVRFVIRNGADITGQAGLGLRAIRLGDRLTMVAALGDVATDPAHRGKGIATALLRAAIAEARASPAEAMILFGNSGLYAGHGFRLARNTLRYVAFDDVRTGEVFVQPARGLMVLPLGDLIWDNGAEVDLVGNCF